MSETAKERRLSMPCTSSLVRNGSPLCCHAIVPGCSGNSGCAIRASGGLGSWAWRRKRSDSSASSRWRTASADVSRLAIAIMRVASVGTSARGVGGSAPYAYIGMTPGLTNTSRIIIAGAYGMGISS